MLPCLDMFVELETIDPASNWFVLSRSMLDSTKELGPDNFEVFVDGAFKLDQSMLDVVVLEGIWLTQPGYIWQNVTSTSTFIDINRGVDATQGIASRPFAGSMKVQVVDPYLDSLANQYVGIGTKTRLRVGSDIAFLGYASEMRTEYDAQGVPTLYLTAYDGIARMNSISMAARTAETYQQRLTAVANAAELTYTLSGSGQSLTATNDEKTALETLIAAQDSEGSLVWMNRTNKLRGMTRDEDVLVAPVEDWLFSNDHTVSGHICMSAFSTTMDTEQVINQITFNNLEWNGTNWENVQYTYSDAASAKYYGVKKQSISTTLDPNTLGEYAQAIFARYADASRKVKRVAFPMDHFVDRTIPAHALIDIGDVVKVYLNDPINTALEDLTDFRRVGQINHRITPQMWETQVSLL